MQSATPEAVSALGVTRVRARPSIDRVASRLAPVVYPRLRLAALLTGGTLAGSFLSGSHRMFAMTIAVLR